jgi:DNA (cytosine-5)-methyltransferase 1
MKLKMLDLFSGIGGFSLAAHWTGQIETVAFCEIEPFCQKVLQKHWPDVPIFEDVRTLKGKDVGPVDIVCGGYPCQPFSLAGERRGEEDDRHLWPEVHRLLQELRPAWFLGENVAGHISMGLDQVLSDLEDIGYTGQALVIPACAKDAPHRRDRVWVVAYRDGLRVEGPGAELKTAGADKHPGGYWGATQPRALRVDNGIPDRIHRIKALGNSIVPQVAYEIFFAMIAAH